MSQTITTKKLGELLHHWHDSQSDPIYGVGSFLVAGKPVDEEKVKKTREAIRKLLKSAEHGSHGWGQAEVEELKTISDGLAGLLRLYRFGEMPTLADFRTHLTNGKDAQGRRYISPGKPILHFELKGATGQQALAAANKADENRATAGKGRADIQAVQKGDTVALGVNNIESLYDWIFALTQSGAVGGKLAKVVMEDLGYSWTGAAQNPAKRTMSIREAQRERAKGAAWFRGLRREQKFELGDAFVLDTFDWRDWMDDKPTSAFLNGADEARMNWEI